MALAYDNSTTGSLAASVATTISLTMTISSSNPVLLAAVNLSVGSTQTVSSVKIGTTAFTKINAINNTTSTNKVRAELWYLAAPPSGSQTVVITFSSSVNAEAAIISLTGAAQSSPIGASGTNTSTATPVTAAITTTTANSWLVDALALDFFWQPTGVLPNNGGTSRATLTQTGSGIVSTSTLTTTTAGSVTDGWKWTEGTNPSGAAYVVAEVIALNTTVNISVFDSSAATENTITPLLLNNENVNDASTATDVLTTINTPVVLPVQQTGNREIIGVRIIG